MRFGRDAGVTSRRGQGDDRVLRIVESVNDVMRCARMVWVLLINLKRNRARLGLQAITPVFRTHQAKQGK